RDWTDGSPAAPASDCRCRPAGEIRWPTGVAGGRRSGAARRGRRGGGVVDRPWHSRGPVAGRRRSALGADQRAWPAGGGLTVLWDPAGRKTVPPVAGTVEFSVRRWWSKVRLRRGEAGCRLATGKKR